LITSINTDHILNTLARIISVVFHPMLMPLYGLSIIFSTPTIPGYLPFTVKKILFFIVLINNLLIPLTLMPYLKYRNLISSYLIEERQERITPLIITSFFYCVTSYIIFRFQIPFFLKSFIFAATFVVIAVTVINFWWKISVHSVAAGALTAIILILSVKMNVHLILHLICVILISGLILSSRLRLNYHNPFQVWIGYLIGLAGLSFSMAIL